MAAERRLKAFGKGLTIAGGAMAAGGTAILAPLAAAAFSAAKTGDELNKMSNRTGASVESLSELRHAAEQSDVSFDQLGGAMKIMQKNIANGSDAFSKLGLSIDDLLAMQPDQQFEAIAQRISEIKDPAKRTAAAMSVLGKSGADLLPLMIDGAKGIQLLRKEARDLGLQVSTKDANAATLFGDTWANFQKVSKDIVTELGMAMLPALTNITSAIIPIVKNVATWISENRGLIVAIAGIGAGLVAGGSVLMVFSTAAIAAGMAIGSIVSIAGALVGVLGAILSPLGLVVAGVTAATVAFFTMTDAGRSAVKIFSAGFMSVLGTVQEIVSGMFNAIKGGNFALAGKIAFTGFRLVLAESMQSVAEMFGGSLNDMIGMIAGFIDQVRNGFADMLRLGGSVASIIPGMGSQVADINNALARVIESKALFDPESFKVAVQSSLDPAKLRAELAGLNATAASPVGSGKGGGLFGSLVDGATGLLSDAGSGLTGLVSGGAQKGADAIKSGLDWLANHKLGDAASGISEASDRRSQASAGTFSAAEAALLGGGSLQQKQLTAMERVAKNTDPRNRGKLLVTP